MCVRRFQVGLGRCVPTLLVLLAVLWHARGAALAEPATLNARMVPVKVDTGRLENLHAEPAVMFSTVVELGSDDPWVRVLFDKETTLATGSYIRVTSLLDGETQILDAEELENWGYGTAFFNGSSVSIELIAGAKTKSNGLRVEEILVGERRANDGFGEVATICNETGAKDDNRVPSGDLRVGRVLSGGKRELDSKKQDGGCTAFIIDTPDNSDDKLHLTAGHCFGDILQGQDAGVWIFQVCVPDSSADCALVHPDPGCQFPVDRFSVISIADYATEGNFGNDWAVFQCHRQNGISSFRHAGAAFPLAASPGAGNPVRVTGCGIDGTNENNAPGGKASCECDQGGFTGTRNRTRQTSTGSLVEPNETKNDPDTGVNHVLGLDVDVCGGNSGSPIIINSDSSGLGGEAIGIVTEGWCPPYNRGNVIIGNTPLWNAINHEKNSCRAICKDGTSGRRLATDKVTCHLLCDDICGGLKENVQSCFFKDQNVKGNCTVKCKPDQPDDPDHHLGAVPDADACQDACNSFCGSNDQVTACIFKDQEIVKGHCAAECKDGTSGFARVKGQMECHFLCDAICGGLNENVLSCIYGDRHNVKGNCDVFCKDGTSDHISLTKPTVEDCHLACDATCGGKPAVEACFFKGEDVKANCEVECNDRSSEHVILRNPTVQQCHATCDAFCGSNDEVVFCSLGGEVIKFVERKGACCDNDPFGPCVDDVTEAECDCEKCKWFEKQRCDEVVCMHGAIPTVSEWGLVVLTLLLLTGAKVYFGRRQSEALS